MSYTEKEKMALIEESLQITSNLKQFLSVKGIAPTTFYRWKKLYLEKGESGLRRKRTDRDIYQKYDALLVEMARIEAKLELCNKLLLLMQETIGEIPLEKRKELVRDRKPCIRVDEALEICRMTRST